LDDGGRCHPDGWNIKLGARSIPAAGVPSTALRATKLWPADLPCPEPAGRHRISVSTGIWRSSARIRRAGRPRLHQTRPGAGAAAGKAVGGGAAGAAVSGAISGVTGGTAPAPSGAPSQPAYGGYTRLWYNPSTRLRLPSEIGTAPQACRRMSRRLPLPRCSHGGAPLTLSAQAA
jgi:hypothetical protein